jgi:hypothetical protein
VTCEVSARFVAEAPTAASNLESCSFEQFPRGTTSSYRHTIQFSRTEPTRHPTRLIARSGEVSFRQKPRRQSPLSRLPVPHLFRSGARNLVSAFESVKEFFSLSVSLFVCPLVRGRTISSDGITLTSSCECLLCAGGGVFRSPSPVCQGLFLRPFTLRVPRGRPLGGSRTRLGQRGRRIYAPDSG